MNKGFTLLEVIVYLALYAIIIAGAVTSAFSMAEGAGRDQSAAMVQEEGAFLIGKIDDALSHARSVQSPTASGNYLAVTLFDDSQESIFLSSTDVRLSRGAAPAQTLNNSNVSVTSLTFTHTLAAGGGIQPESVRADLTLQAIGASGRAVTRTFSTIRYLHK